MRITRPTRNGWSRWASTCCTPMTMPSMISAWTGPSATRASSTATVPDTAAPTTGMNAPKKTSSAMPEANGTPRMAAPMPMPAASTAATTSVARVNADSWAQAIRPGGVHLLACAAREEPHRPAPDDLAVVEEEVEREHRDEEARHDVRRRQARRRRRVGEGARAQPLTRLVDVPRELGVGDPEGRVEPAPDLVDAVGDLRPDVVDLAGQLAADERQHPEDHRQRADHGDAGRHARAGPAGSARRRPAAAARRAGGPRGSG